MGSERIYYIKECSAGFYVVIEVNGELGRQTTKFFCTAKRAWQYAEKLAKQYARWKDALCTGEINAIYTAHPSETRACWLVRY